jgi:hypothetical protein
VSKAEKKRQADIAELASLLHDYWTGCPGACDHFNRAAQKVYAILEESGCTGNARE